MSKTTPTKDSIRAEFEELVEKDSFWSKFVGSQFVSMLTLFITQIVYRCFQYADAALAEGFISTATRRSSSSSCYCAPAFSNWWDRHVPDGCPRRSPVWQFVGIGYGDLCCSDSWRGGVPIGATRGLGVINYVLNGNDSQQ